MNSTAVRYLALTLGVVLGILVGVVSCQRAQSAGIPYAPYVAGHRGVTGGTVPENSLAAFRAADAAGVNYLETDVRWTRDGHMVIMHDATVDSTTDCVGEVAKMTLAQLRACPLADGSPVPLLADLLALGTRAGLMVEVKAEDVTAAQARAYAAAVRSARVRVVTTSFSTATLRLVRAQGLVHTGRVTAKASPSVADVLAYGRYYAPEIAEVTPAEAKALRAAGVYVYGWHRAGQQDAAMERARALNLRGVIVDDPAQVL